MIALWTTVFVASLLGSLHCVGMCGAFVAFSVGDDPRGIRAHLALQGAYHGGRLVSYALLGAVAGSIGAALDLSGAIFGIQRVALVVAGLAMIVFGVVTILRLRGFRIREFRLPGPLGRLFLRGQAFARNRPPLPRALSIGLLSTLLPCGWLYAFAVTAAGTGSSALGAMTMAVFWLGTLPALAALGAGVRGLAGPLRRQIPLATAVALVVVGLAAILGRFNVPALDLGRQSGDRPQVTLQEAAERVESLDSREMPCCSETD